MTIVKLILLAILGLGCVCCAGLLLVLLGRDVILGQGTAASAVAQVISIVIFGCFTLAIAVAIDGEV